MTAHRNNQSSFSEISPSEFFYRNRDLAGFSNPAKALYTATRELVENSLDACESTEILPKISVRIRYREEERHEPDPRTYVLTVKDNGHGIEPRQAPNAFGRVFYGSKYRLRQARGMFGMGGTMAILYGQITTSKPVTITTSTDGREFHTFRLLIDIQNNKPIILSKSTKRGVGSTGTSVELLLHGDIFRASAKIRDYFRQTALVTPYAEITFIDPQGRLWYFPQTTATVPKVPRETKPHPHGFDFEAMRRLLKHTDESSFPKLLMNEFHRVGKQTARNFLRFAKFDLRTDPRTVSNEETVRLVEAMHRFDGFLPPDSNCLSPLGTEILKAGIVNELQPEFYSIAIRPPSAYSGYPFIVEVALAYGGKIIGEGVRLYRFANRIPLLYDEASDVAGMVVNDLLDRRAYNIPREAPLAVITHVCSTKIPYKSVGKEFLAERPELERELKNGLRETLRQLKSYLSRKGSIEAVLRRKNIYAKYLPLIAQFSQALSGAKSPPRYQQLIKDFEDERVITVEQIANAKKKSEGKIE